MMHDYQAIIESFRRPGECVRVTVTQGTADAGGTDDDEAPCVEQLAGDEPLAFWSLWEQYRTELYRCCLRWMGGDPHEATEALSHVALKVLRMLPCRMDNIANPKAWLLRLTYNLCMDMHRGRRRYVNTVTQLEECGERRSEAIVRDLEQPEQVLLRQELGEYLQQAIARLPLRLREPFVLRFVEGVPCWDIAQQLALTPENVRKRLQHARVLVRNELHAYLSADDGCLKFTN